MNPYLKDFLKLIQNAIPALNQKSNVSPLSETVPSGLDQILNPDPKPPSQLIVRAVDIDFMIKNNQVRPLFEHLQNGYVLSHAQVLNFFKNHALSIKLSNWDYREFKPKFIETHSSKINDFIEKEMMEIETSYLPLLNKCLKSRKEKDFDTLSLTSDNLWALQNIFDYCPEAYSCTINQFYKNDINLKKVHDWFVDAEKIENKSENYRDSYALTGLIEHNLNMIHKNHANMQEKILNNQSLSKDVLLPPRNAKDRNENDTSTMPSYVFKHKI